MSMELKTEKLIILMIRCINKPITNQLLSKLTCICSDESVESNSPKNCLSYNIERRKLIAIARA